MMRSPIPKEMREQLSEDPFMKRCALWDSECEVRIEWHHAISYAGKRVNELWAIIPLCTKHHREESKNRAAITEITKDRILHFKAGKEVKDKYPKLVFHR